MITINLPNVEVDFNGVDSLFAERQGQYSFMLIGARGKMKSPHVTLIQSDYSEQGSIDLIEFIKTQALATTEVWEGSNMPKCLFIRYYNWNMIILGNSQEPPNPMGEIELFTSEDVSETGLVSLVDELLDWMKE